jgi:predicted transcriptional regulator
MDVQMPRGLLGRRRSPHDVVADILRSATKGAKKTRLLYDAKLSFDQAKRYLPALEEAGFIAEDSGRWKTTKKGLHVIEVCELCERLFRGAPRSGRKP